MVNKIFELSDADFIDLIKSSLCVKEVLFKLGYSTNGNSWGYSQVKERMSILKLTTKDFKGKSGMMQQNEEIALTPEELFTKNNHPRSIVRKRLIALNLIEYKCSICGISEWQGKKLSLELDHINGINNDHQLSNLRFLCPNCHSQTSTYGAKNKDTYITDFEITEEMKTKVEFSYRELKNISKVAKRLGFKEKVVKEIINELGLTETNQRYVIRYDKNKNEIMRFGSIAELCNYLIEHNEVKTKIPKTCRNTFLRNCDNFWLNSYWKLMDA